MDTLETRRIADAANRLLHDDVLTSAFEEARRRCLEELAKVDPTNSQAIMELQAQIAAIAKVRKSLEDMTLRVPQTQRVGLSPIISQRTA